MIVAVAHGDVPRAPEVATYFTRAQMPIAEMNAMLQALSVDGATVESVADTFVAKRPNVWRPWVGPAADRGSGLCHGPASIAAAVAAVDFGSSAA